MIPAALALLLGLALGCATTQQTSGLQPSGFLDDYSQLRAGGDGQTQRVYVDPDADFSRYTEVLIDPVSIWRGADSSLDDVSEDDLRRLAHHLEAALQKQLGKDFRIVEKPADTALRIRTAITEAVGSRVALDLATTALLPLSAVKKLATGTHAFVGRAAIEIEILDSVSGRRLVAAADERAGAKSLWGSTDTWSDVEQAYDFWAERLAYRLAAFRAIDAAAEPEAQ